MQYYHNNKDKKECEGCHLREVCIMSTSYIDPETNETIKCPCSICLVKVICNYSMPCEEYRSYSKVMHKIGRGKQLCTVTKIKKNVKDVLQETLVN